MIMCLRHLQGMLQASQPQTKDQLSLGQLACVRLVADVLRQQQQQERQQQHVSTGLPAVELQLLLDVAISSINHSSKSLQTLLQSHLLPPVLAAAADVLQQPIYLRACRQLLSAVCAAAAVACPGTNDAAATLALGSSTWGKKSSSGEMSDALSVCCRLLPHILAAAGSSGELLSVCMLSHDDTDCYLTTE
jgi:hypothetical protein